MNPPLTFEQQKALLQINSARRKLEHLGSIAKTSRIPEVSGLGREVDELADLIWFASLDLGVWNLLEEDRKRRGR
ncbi:hypothetical protein [Candidatus Methanocrinis natronophilus]|uniref:NTP pyrophosphohydrolase MazG putative catalytic core domain-containing protein n=1 Tax=Candidatus Methanocrinis natronophilus TaxID=3033396 RepID=A0ABT5XAF4_9EURY|nr:hypothetical protein [Candidatus Methanocrinis natronophilus]MDF0591678.1 hypothetical protein [Candidatus Methanocrinis natronophilus]